MRVMTLEAHVGGAAVRLITAGVPSIQGATMAERQQSFEDQSSVLAHLLTREPRGHAGMVSVVLTEGERTEADAGLLFATGTGPRSHSGHAAMAAAALALAHGLVTPRQPWLDFDTVAGSCRVQATMLGSQSWRVRYEGPPAAVLKGNLRVTTGRRTLQADLAWSGTDVVAIVEGEAAGVPLSTTHTLDLRRAGREIIETIDGMVKLAPPGSAATRPVTACAFVGPASGTDADVRTVVVRADGTVSRSPSVSGSAAVAVVLAAMGLLSVERPSRHESLAGSSWTTEISSPSPDGARVVVTAEVYETGSCEWVIGALDPLTSGVLWM